MFLSLLNDKQKKMFLSLAYDLAAIDGDFGQDEKTAIESYSREMDMDMKREDADEDINHVIEQLNENCGLREKKIVVFEMIGLAMTDCNYDKGEREVVRNAIDVFGLDAEFANYCEQKLSEYLNLQEELNTKILM